MAYTPATLLCMVDRIGAGPAWWSYSNTDAHGTVAGAGYFSDGASRGLKVNDVVIVVDTDSNTCTVHMAISSIAVAAATLA